MNNCCFYDSIDDCEFIVYHADKIDDKHYFYHRLCLKVGDDNARSQGKIYKSYKKAFITLAVKAVPLCYIRDDVLNTACKYVDKEVEREIDKEIFKRYALFPDRH